MAKLRGARASRCRELFKTGKLEATEGLARGLVGDDVVAEHHHAVATAERILRAGCPEIVSDPFDKLRMTALFWSASQSRFPICNCYITNPGFLLPPAFSHAIV